MGDKETRRRKKQRRESAKKEETDDSSPARELSQTQENVQKKKPEDNSSHNLNEPSILAKLIFCVLFMLLISAVGLIFYALNEATKDSGESLEEHEEIHSDSTLPIIDDSHDVDDEDHDTDSPHDEFEDEEGHESDVGLEPNIDAIINNIEESITYNVDGPENIHQEINANLINTEDNNLDSSPEQLEVPRELPTSQQLNTIDSNSEDLYPTVVVSETSPANELLSDDEIQQSNKPTDSVSSTNSPIINSPTETEDDFDESDDEDSKQEVPNQLEESLGDQAEESPEIKSVESEAKEQFFEESRADNVEDISSDSFDENNPEESLPLEEKPYENQDITNDFDFLFREDLDEADNMVEKSLENARTLFDRLLRQYPKSSRVNYGKARLLDKEAEKKRSNAIMEQAIDRYKIVMSFHYTPEKLYLIAGNRAVDRLRFRGMVRKALVLQTEMVAKFPDNILQQNQLAVSYMCMGENTNAKRVLKKVLAKFPNNGFAKVHLGFIMKTDDQNYSQAIKLLSEGIASKEEGVVDGRFYYHLGDALHRTGFPDKALKVYEEGVQVGVFLSTLQRSLYNVNGLLGKPWWNPQETPYEKDFELLEKNWRAIRNEALSLLSDKHGGFEPETEGLQNTGDWKQFNLFLRGKKLASNCQKAPLTCQLIQSIPKAANCKRGQAKFSIMKKGTHVFAHTGPTNTRLRSHLGLVVPEGPKMRVGNEIREWKEGKVILFDDSFEHEVWHEGASDRIVLIVDFWHPHLSDAVIKTLTPI